MIKSTPFNIFCDKWIWLYRSLVVPMRWPVEESRIQSTGHEDDNMQGLSRHVHEFEENVHESGNTNSFSFYLLCIVIIVITYKLIMLYENWNRASFKY